MHAGRTAAVAATALALAVPAAHADRTPPLNALDRTAVGAHFVLHFRDADFATPDEAAAYAAAGLADFEESHSRLVAGGGGVPNAGLKAPVADDDGRTDVYLSPPQSKPDFKGGTVLTDTTSPHPRYVFMTPGMSRSSFRFRAAHEYMHVLQGAYTRHRGMLTESSANWAAEHALPDVDPLDSNLSAAPGGSAPWLPLTCSYGKWDERSCGRGYWQWLFLQYLTERGYATIDKLWTRQAKLCTKTCTMAQDQKILADTIAAAAPGTTLGAVFAAYARDVYDPTRWKTTAVAKIPKFSTGAEYFNQQTPDTGVVALPPLARLAVRYVRVINREGLEPTGPDDRLEITVSRPGDQTTPVGPMVRPLGADGWVDLPALPLTGGSFSTPFDPASVEELLIPLVNDTTTDGAAISYHVRRVAGTPTPPANDTREAALRVALGRVAETDNVYAGFVGDMPTPACTAFSKATRGVWFTFIAPGSGRYTFSVAESDFVPAVAVSDHVSGAVLACGSRARSASLTRGRRVDVLVARMPQTSPGHVAKLRVTGPGSPVTPPEERPPDAAGPPVITRLDVARRKLRPALRKGLRVTVGCSLACDVQATVRVPAKLARKAGLAKRGTAKVARGETALADAAEGVVNVRFTKKARKRLLALVDGKRGGKRLRKARLRVVVSAWSPDGHTRRSVRVTLRR